MQKAANRLKSIDRDLNSVDHKAEVGKQQRRFLQSTNKELMAQIQEQIQRNDITEPKARIGKVQSRSRSIQSAIIAQIQDHEYRNNSTDPKAQTRNSMCRCMSINRAI